ncbi:uncharacterized protein cenpt [Pseudorasbora parva]|uniref:uncharacterized protein cenpt n=1 Tax=Pseudorasbora parva TaxID=51549 RepID=UPI00351F3681
MDSTEEDISARVLLRRVLHTELPRSPVTRSSTNVRRSMRMKNTPGLESPGSALRHRLKKKLHESASLSPLPSPKRPRSMAPKTDPPVAAPSPLYDEDMTTRGLLRGIIQMETEASLLMSGQPALQEAELNPAESSVSSAGERTEGLSGVELSDLTLNTEPLTHVVRGLSRRKTQRAFSVSAFERQFDQLPDNTEDVSHVSHRGGGPQEKSDASQDFDSSAGSKSGLNLTLKTPFVDKRIERAGLQRKVSNRKLPSVDAFDEAVQRCLEQGPNQDHSVVQDGKTLEDSLWQKFTLGLNDVTELYAHPKKRDDTVGPSQEEEEVLPASQEAADDVVLSPVDDIALAPTQPMTESLPDSQDVELQDREYILEVETENVVEVETENVEEDDDENVEEVEAGDVEEDDDENVEEVEAGDVEEDDDENVEEVEAGDVEEDDDENVVEVETENVVEVETENVVEVETENVVEVETENVVEVETENVVEVETEKVEEVEGGDVEEVETENVEEVEAGHVEEVETENVEEDETEDLKEVEAGDVEEVEVENMEEIEKENVDEVENENMMVDDNYEKVEEENIEEVELEGAENENIEENTDASHYSERITHRAHRSEGGGAVLGVPASTRVTKSFGAGLNPREKDHLDFLDGNRESLQDVSDEEREQAGCLVTEVTTPEQRSSQREASLAEEDLPRPAEHHDAPEEVSQSEEEEELMDCEPANQSPDLLQEEEEEEEDDDDDEDALSAELSMKTPAFIRQKRVFASPSVQPIPTVLKEVNAGPAPQATKRAPRQKRQTGDDVLPKSYVMSMFKHFSKTKVASDVYPVINEFLKKYFDRLADDLEVYATHAKRKTIEVEDFELLMRRQGFLKDGTPVNILIEKYLPLEYRKLLIPVATSGNKVIPTQRR